MPRATVKGNYGAEATSNEHETKPRELIPLENNDSNLDGNDNNNNPYPEPASTKTRKANATPFKNSAAMSDPKNTGKKKHVCPICDRGFTTSGHLARHSRVHTGERNHKCPFPGCETRCSRQDNLQQHYRIHLSPGSRRSSSRSSRGARGSNAVQSTVNMATLAPPSLEQPPALVPASMSDAESKARASVSSASNTPPPPVEPPQLESAVRMYQGHHSPAPPPESPPALAQSSLPPMHQRHQQHQHRPSRSSSPERYQQYSHEQPSHLQYRENYYQRPGNYPEGEFAPNGYPSGSSHPHIGMEYAVDRSHSPVSPLSSRHSISHISHPQGYHSHSQSPVPPYQESPNIQAYHHAHPSQSQSPMSENGRRTISRSPPAPQSSNSTSYSPYDGSLSYSPEHHHPHHLTPVARYHSPPPILAPLQGIHMPRNVRTDRNEYDDRRAYPPMQHDYGYFPHPSIQKGMGIVGTLVQ